MATVFMKWLETSPKDYERGIQLLTLGRLRRMHEAIAGKYARPGMRVLEIGCGTGELAVMMAEHGAQVTALDSAPAMLAEARKKVEAEGLEDWVTIKRADAAVIEDLFEPHSFDLIVSTLMFSEIPAQERAYILAACAQLLKPDGALLVGDEVVPSGWRRALYALVRTPLVLLTWLLTRTSTHPLRAFSERLAANGFEAETAESYLGGSLVLYRARPSGAAAELTPAVSGRLRHHPTLWTWLKDLYLLFFRLIPPYPKIEPGLYAVGEPDASSPVLVTGNFDLTIRRLVRAIDGKVDAWVLAADSAGINVWCAAGGGFLTAEKITAAVRFSRLEEFVDHHALILPQLAANGVDGWALREQADWGVHWGPARAEDIPAYLEAKRKKTEDMRTVRFPFKDRFEMVTVALGMYGLMLLLPVFFFWRHLFWPVAFSLVGLTYFYALTLLILPGRDGLQKSIPLAVLALLGLGAYAGLSGGMPPESLFGWGVGLVGLSVFVAAEMQGMSPLMRGEQANWGWEAVIFSCLGLVYWLAPLALGWR